MRPIVAVTKTKYVGRRKRGFEGKAFKQNFVVVYIELDNQLPEVQKNSGFFDFDMKTILKATLGSRLQEKNEKKFLHKKFLLNISE